MYEAGVEQPGTMAAVLGLDGERVEELCRQVTEGIVRAANLNAPGQVVLSGEPAAVEAAMNKAKEAGAKRVVPLQVSGAFHSPLMESAYQGLRSALSEVELRPAAFPVVANASANPVIEPEAIRESLARQLLNPVRWEESMRYLLNEPGPPFLEVGPGKVLRGLLRGLDRKAECRPAGTPEEIEEVAS
jgi:[acyl-carrier-protein] S-malonyltransferase